MIKLHRGPAPEIWTRENVKRWTERWLEKDCESGRWRWPQIGGKRLNEYAYEALDLWHHHKCAFCEIRLTSWEIEHYRSKMHYGLAAFVWRNLFLVCPNCNRAKGEKEHEGCLKPDRDNPEDYLWVNPISLKIEPKPGISEEAKQRAENTIELYKLARPELSREYEYYLRMHVYVGGPGLETLRFIMRLPESQHENSPEVLQAKLVALTDASQPFSLMVKSLLAY